METGVKDEDGRGKSIGMIGEVSVGTVLGETSKKEGKNFA